MAGSGGVRPASGDGRRLDLNLIERLWGHLKRTVLANVLYRSLDDLVAAFRKGVRRATVKRERMGFMVDHDDLLQEIRQEAPDQHRHNYCCGSTLEKEDHGKVSNFIPQCCNECTRQ